MSKLKIDEMLPLAEPLKEVEYSLFASAELIGMMRCGNWSWSAIVEAAKLRGRLTSQAPVSSPGHVSGVFVGHGAVTVDVFTDAGGGGGGGGGGHPSWQESATNQTGIHRGSPTRVWLYKFQAS
jgi:hypothetical protein